MRVRISRGGYFSGSLAALFVIIAISLVLFSCGTMTGTRGTSTSSLEVTVATYEDVALGLNAVKGYIKGQEITGQLQGADLDKAVAQWEMARQLFIQSGESLKASVAARDLLTQQQRLEAYNALLQKAALELGKLNYLKGGK